MALVFGKGLDPRNSGVGHGNFGPVVAGDLVAGGQREEEIVALCVASGGERDGAEGARAQRVRRIMVLEDLDVGAEFHTEITELGSANTGDNGSGTEGIGDAILPWEGVETVRDMSHHVDDKKLRQALKR